MAYASRAGRARTNASAPQAHAICDRCGFRYNHVDLKWQYQYAGAGLQNLRILVCCRCLDTPQDQLRSIVIPADPVPVINPRPEFYVLDEEGTSSPPFGSDFSADYNADFGHPGQKDFNADFNSDFNSGSGGDVGYPIGIDQRAQMPIVAGLFWAVPVKLISVLSNGSALITVNTNGPHGLSVNAQIGVQGLNNPLACGDFSIFVVNATQFTYIANTAIPTASMANNYTRMVTMNVGLPYGVTTIPAVGP